MFKEIHIDREKLTIMGVEFSDRTTFESTANAIGSNMFEGFKPSYQNVAVIRDYILDKLSLNDLLTLIKEKNHV